MITPSAVTPYESADFDIVKGIEAKIDQQLQDRRGIAEMPVYESKEPFIDRRVWAHIARRYSNAGWIVYMVEDNGAVKHTLVIEHPELSLHSVLGSPE